MALVQQDYEYLADQAVESFVRSKTPLNDTIVKIAGEHDFNPDQVKRLVEMANVKAFLKIFREPGRTESDVDFDVADSDSILKKFYAAPGGQSVTITKVTVNKMPTSDLPYEFESDCPDMNRTSRHGALPSFSLDAEPAARGPDRHVIIMKLRKVAEELVEKVYDTEHTYIDSLDKIASEFAHLYGPDYAVFEKEAMHVYGDSVEPLLGDIRNALRWTKPMYKLEKTASGRMMVDTTRAEFCEFDKMVETKKAQVKYAKAAKLAKQKLKGLTDASE